MGDNKKPYFKPGKFAGNISENIDSFLKNYQRAAFINGWSEAEKFQYFPIFLEGTALIFYDNIMDTVENIKWPDLEKKFRLEFEPIAQTYILRLMLEKRKQKPNEQNVSYINEVESLCRRINKDMSQEEIVRNIMKGLKPTIVRSIGMLGNKTLDEFKKNVRKYELIEYMTAESTETPFEIETEITQHNVQQINTNNKIKNNENSKLREEIENLKETINQLKISQINNNSNYQNNFNNVHDFKQDYAQRNLDTPCWDQNPISYNQIPHFNKYYSTLRYNKDNKTNDNYINNSAYIKQCSICSKNNHTEYECDFKNKPNITCQLCNKYGHSATNCHSTNNKSKKLNTRLNTSDNFSPLITDISKQNMNRINYKPDALYIEAKFNNTTLPITIDTGANICCIREELLPNNYTITPTTVQLSGPDNKPLYVAGISKIQIQINNNYFDINTHVVKNLSSTIILGNDFLIKNNALIDFKDNNIILNNNINVQLKINNTNSLNCINNTNNIKEIKGSIFNCPDNFAIAHCISSDLKMNKGLTNLISKVYGDTKSQLVLHEINVGDTIPISNKYKTIFHLITKEFHYHKPKYKDLKASIHNLKREAIKLNISKIAIPTLASGQDKSNWSIVKQLIYSEFQNTNIEIHIYYKNEKDITHKSKEYTNTINNIRTYCDNNNNDNKTETKIIDTQYTTRNQAYNIFSKYKPGENILSDGNCGIYAVCKALNDNKKINKITSILEL